MAISNPALTYTLDDFISMKISDDMTYYNFSILEVIDGVEHLDSNLVEIYLEELKSQCISVQFSEEELKKYKYNADLLAYDLLEYKCSECGCDGTWRGKILALQLHHKNGNHLDNTLTNLTFLCPNCHAITDSFGGKNNFGQERVK